MQGCDGATSGQPRPAAIALGVSSSRMKIGTTGRPVAAAATSAGLSVQRKSWRNQTRTGGSEVIFMGGRH